MIDSRVQPFNIVTSGCKLMPNGPQQHHSYRIVNKFGMSRLASFSREKGLLLTGRDKGVIT